MDAFHISFSWIVIGRDAGEGRVALQTVFFIHGGNHSAEQRTPRASGGQSGYLLPINCVAMQSNDSSSMRLGVASDQQESRGIANASDPSSTDG